MKQKRRTMKWKIILISLIVLLVVSLIFSIAVLVNANSSQWYFRDTNAPTGPTAKASTDTDSFPSVQMSFVQKLMNNYGTNQGEIMPFILVLGLIFIIMIDAFAGED